MCQSIASILKSRRTLDTTELGKGLEESGHFPKWSTSYRFRGFQMKQQRIVLPVSSGIDNHFPKRVTCNINNVVNDLEFGRSLD
jgi:hypothetical protein